MTKTTSIFARVHHNGIIAFTDEDNSVSFGDF
jgi:hypothetical protein